MIISYAYNFIYFRPKKTGSSTIVEILRSGLDAEDFALARSLADGSGSTYPVHIKAVDVKKLVPPDFWERAFKFTSERHPYEKAVSLAFFRLGKQRDRREHREQRANKRFPKLLDRFVAGDEYCGFEYYSIDGKPLMNDVIRHENFEADLRRIAERLGLQVPDNLPRSKSGYRTDQRPAREILSDEQRYAVFQKCLPEFELFGYEP